MSPLGRVLVKVPGGGFVIKLWLVIDSAAAVYPQGPLDEGASLLYWTDSSGHCLEGGTGY